MSAGRSKVGFIGIGNMGWPMARNLAKAGHDLLVYDTDTSRAVRFAREFASSPAAVLADLAVSDIIITMLPTGKVVRDVFLAPDSGLAAHLRPGTLVIDMSSSEPSGTRQLGQALAALNLALVDAPVSGAVPRAESGTLTIMMGGDDPAVTERAKVVLAAIGNRIFDTGTLGTGHAMKALNNFVAAAGYCAAAEALAIGGRFGLDPTRMLEIINTSTGRNFNTEVVMKEHLVDGKFATGFALGLMAKDIKAAADLGAELHVTAPLSVLVSERWQEALRQFGPAQDFSAAALAWEA